MNHRNESPFERLLAAWVGVVARARVWVVLATVLGAAGAIHYTITHFEVDTNRDKMLSESLPFRRTFEQYEKDFPQFVDDLALVIDADTPERADLTAEAVAKRLRDRSDLFERVYIPRADPFLVRHSLLYLGVGELTALSERLAEIQPFLGKLTQDPTLRGLCSMLSSAVEARATGTRIELDPLLRHMADVLGAVLAGRPARLSWQELMQDAESTPAERRQIVLAQPRLNYGKLFPAQPAMDAVHALRTEMGLDGGGPARLRITGGLALGHEELKTVTRGMEVIGALVLCIVALLLWLGLRTMRLVAATLITLVVGLIFTAAFAMAAVGHLNLISVAFAALYLGLGVDYAIHLCLRYEELAWEGRPRIEAMRYAAVDVGGSLWACAVTTALGFFAFVPTAYRGVSELGLISGTGMFISFFVTMTFLPALLLLMRLHGGGAWKVPGAGPVGKVFVEFPIRRRKAVLLATAVLTVVALILIPRVRFDYNPLNLRDPESESVRAFRELLKNSEDPPWSATIMAKDAAAARTYSKKLEELPTVDKVITLQDLVPRDQEKKLPILADLALILGPGPEIAERAAPPTRGEEIAALDGLDGALAPLRGKEPGTAVAPLESRLRALLGRLRRQAPQEQSKLLNRLRHALLDYLPFNLDRLHGALQAAPVAVDDLPERLVSQWVGKSGDYRVEVYPKQNLDEIGTMRRFVRQVQEVAPQATGSPVLMIESGVAVVHAFQQAFLVALLTTAVALLWALRRARDVLLVLIPLVLAGLFTGAAMVALGQPFNFANVIALPLLLGIGVDGGIHMVHRARHALHRESNPLKSSTARAVVYSALTTMCSFANLALSPHRGTASMGILLTIGITCMLVCTLLVLPALLAQSRAAARVPPG